MLALSAAPTLTLRRYVSRQWRVVCRIGLRVIISAHDRGKPAGVDARKDQVLRQIIRCMVAVALPIVALVVTLGPASAQGRLEARYTATIAGIPIGSGSWAIDVVDTQYTAAANGSTSGLLRAFTGGQ